VLGICNGFQILCEAGLLPGVLIRNASLRFICRDQWLRVENTSTTWTSRFEPDAEILIPMKNAEGCFVAAGSRIGNGANVADGTSNDPRADAGFFAEVFNVEAGDDLAGRAAEAYAKFLRKTHAQDGRLDEHKNVKPAARRSIGDEPPPTQEADVGGVVDAMMLELQEMEHRRQDSIKKRG